MTISFPESSFPLTSGRKKRALGATISGMRHRCRLRNETGWAEHQNSVISKWLLPELSFSDRWSRGTKTLGTRLNTGKKLAYLHMRSDGDDGGSDGDDGISFDVLEIVCCCLLMLCETNKSHNH